MALIIRFLQNKLTLITLNLAMLLIVPLSLIKSFDWLNITCASLAGIIAFIDVFLIVKKITVIGKKINQIRFVKLAMIILGFIGTSLILSYELWLGFTTHSIWHVTMGLYYLFILIIKSSLVYLHQNSITNQKVIGFTSLLLLLINLILIGIIILTLHHYHQIIYDDNTIYLISTYTFIMLIKAIITLCQKNNHFKNFFNFYSVINLVTALISLYNMQSLMLAKYSFDSVMTNTFMINTGIAICIIIFSINLLFVHQNKLFQN